MKKILYFYFYYQLFKIFISKNFSSKIKFEFLNLIQYKIKNLIFVKKIYNIFNKNQNKGDYHEFQNYKPKYTLVNNPSIGNIFLEIFYNLIGFSNIDSIYNNINWGKIKRNRRWIFPRMQWSFFQRRKFWRY